MKTAIIKFSEIAKHPTAILSAKYWVDKKEKEKKAKAKAKKTLRISANKVRVGDSIKTQDGYARVLSKISVPPQQPYLWEFRMDNGLIMGCLLTHRVTIKNR